MGSNFITTDADLSNKPQNLEPFSHLPDYGKNILSSGHNPKTKLQNLIGYKIIHPHTNN